MSEDPISYFQPCEEEFDHPFVMVPRDLVRNCEISPECKWFISYLLSHSGKWRVSIPYVIKNQNVSKNRIYPIINEAIEAGYVRRDEYLDKGKKRYTYTVSREAKFKKSLLCPQNQDTENQDPENEDTRVYKTIPKGIEEEKEKKGGTGGDKPPDPHPTFSFERVSMEQPKYDQLVKEFGEPKIKEMVDRLNEYADINPKRFKQYACHAAVIRKWIREDGEKKSATPGMAKAVADDARVAENKALGKKIAHQYPEKTRARLIRGSPDAIEFILGPNHPGIIVKYSEYGFREQALNAVRKMGLDPTGL